MSTIDPVIADASRPEWSRRCNMATCCRFCGAALEHTFVDLGLSPLCETLVTPETIASPETFYPLHVRVCHACFLVQVEANIPPGEIFGTGDYPYFSSYSDSWVEHARRYTGLAIERFGLDRDSRVVEIASNDGYLLQHFDDRGIPALGIDPAANCAEAARARGIETVVAFFGRDLAERLRDERGPADLVIGNNVLAHVPDINDFVTGLAVLLAPGGVVTMEFPHLMRLVEQRQYDTIYHEHYSYLSLTSVELIFCHHGLTIFDVEELPTHGGSLRVYARHADAAAPPVADAIEDLRGRELGAGVRSLDYYRGFGEAVAESKRRLLQFLIEARDTGKSVAGYGAPGKGNTLLNYCGIRTDLLEYTVDRNPIKQGNYTAGTRIPIHAPDRILETRPDFVLILPWNLKTEIMDQMRAIRDWGGRFVIPIPVVEVL